MARSSRFFKNVTGKRFNSNKPLISVEVSGVNKALKSLDAAMQQIAGLTKSRIREALFEIKRHAQDHTPVDTGFLQKSAYVSTGDDPNLLKSQGLSGTAITTAPRDGQPGKRIKDYYGRVGYAARYAAFVHEDGVSRNWTGAKFLEKGIIAAMGDVKKILREPAKIKYRKPTRTKGPSQ